ncbi:MAG: hypothetical protein ISR83_06470 [Candidatus Marinimicrobia bacterium]|nr:hypothetical protein [Candidatus Neomarinimicrobiota bacterium]
MGRWIFIYFVSLIILFGKGGVGGLQLKSIYDQESGSDDSYLNLTIDDPFRFSEQFSLEFDFYIYGVKPFGFICSGHLPDEKDYFTLTYIDFRNPDTSYIDLSFIDNVSILSIPLVNEYQGRNIWSHLELKFNLLSDSVGIAFNNQNMNWAKYVLPNEMKLNLIFGESAYRKEAPRIGIQNIKVFNTDQRLMYRWALNELSGNWMFDDIKNKKAFASNVKYLSNRHSEFEKIVEFPVKQYSPIAFSVENNRSGKIFAITDSSLLELNLVRNTLFNYPIATKFPHEPSFIYNQKLNEITVCADGGLGNVGVLNMETFNWQWGNDTSSIDQYFEAALVVNENSGDLYRIGGYGWYKVKNDIFHYSREKNKWRKISYHLDEGESFYPRTPLDAAFNRDNSIYILGGFGNKTGQQELGFSPILDLWEFNILTEELTRKWSITNPILNINNGVIISDINSALISVKEESENKNNSLSYYMIDLNNPVLKKIDIRFDNKYIFDPNIFYVKETNELMFTNQSINRDSISVYALALPILGSEIISLAYSSHELIFIYVILFFVARILFLFYKKSKKTIINETISLKTKSTDINEDASPNTTSTEKPVLPGSIVEFYKPIDSGVSVKMFDEFQVWIDGNPVHYSDWGSKKARELFIFLILKNHHGVSKEDIELTFWPDAHNGSAANSRAVGLSRIRKTLGSYSTFIQKHDERIRLEGNEFLNSDFQMVNWKISDVPLEISEMSLTPLKLYGKEGLMPGFHQEWILDIKTDIERRVFNYAKKTGTQAIAEEKWPILDWIGERLLMWNALDDDGLRFRVIANKKMDKPGVANDIYYKFFNHYEKEIGDVYELEFDSI